MKKFFLFCLLLHSLTPKQPLMSRIGDEFTGRVDQEACLSLVTFLSHYNHTDSANLLVGQLLPVIEQGFANQVRLAPVSSPDKSFMDAKCFGHIFVAETCRLGSRFSQAMDMLIASFRQVKDYALLHGMLQGLGGFTVPMLLPTLETHLERLLENRAVNDADLVAASILHAFASVPSAEHLALARRFRALPLLFPRSWQVSCAGLKLAAASAAHKGADEAEDELMHQCKIIQHVMQTAEPSQSMIEMFFTAVVGARHLGLNSPLLRAVVPALLEVFLLEPTMSKALEARNARECLTEAFFDICVLMIAQKDYSALMSLIQKSLTSEHAVHVLALAGRSKNVSFAAVQLIVPSLLDRLAAGGGVGDHMHATLCASLVQMAQAHPDLHMMKQIGSVLRTAFVTRGYPAHVPDCFNVLAQGLGNTIFQARLLKQLLVLFLYTPIEASVKLLPSITTSLQQLVTTESGALIFMQEHFSPFFESSLRRKVAKMWMKLCQQMDKLSQVNILTAITLSKYVPPLVFLGSDYIKLHADVYVDAVEKLERNRAKEGEFSPFAAYLLDDEVSRHGFLPQVLAIGRRTLEIFLTKFLPPPHKASTVTQELVSRETLVLLDVLGRKASEVTERQFLIEALDRLSNVWTPVLFEKAVLKKFLKLVLNASNPKSSTIFTGDTQAARKEVNEELLACLKRWLNLSLVVAPSKAEALVQDLLLEDKQSATVLLDCIGKLDRSFVFSLERKSRMLGEVQGLGSALDGLDTLEKFILKQYEAGADNTVDDGHAESASLSPKTESAVGSALLRSVAFFVAYPKAPSERLLDSLCRYPARLVTSRKVMANAVFAWSWLIAARPDLELQLLTKLQDQWCWTVDSHKGLFDRTGVASAEGHRAWTAFMSEQIFTTTRSLEWAQNASAVLLHALKDPLHLNPSINALGARFEMLLLCSKMIQSGRIEDLSTESQLRERMLLTGLGYFQQKPSWYNLNENLVADVTAIVSFCRSIRDEESAFRVKCKKLPEDILSSVPTVLERTRRASVVETQLDSAKKRNIMQSVQWKNLSVANSTIRPSGAVEGGLKPPAQKVMPLVSPRKPIQDAGVPTGLDAAAETYFTNIDSKRKLVLLLLGNELDRIAAWTNPQSSPAKMIPGMVEFSAVPIVARYQVESFVQVAWQVSPEIAIHMGSRFPAVQVQEMLQKLVLDRTEEVLHIPEAVRFLLTEENVHGNVPQLKWLLHWTRCHALDALRVLMSRFGGHSFVTSWAGTVLASLGARKVLFYLPQLIQALRWDKSGRLGEYLAFASRNSVLICHQTLWSTAAYMDIAESGIPEDVTFVHRITQLQDRIKAEMTDLSREKWTQESGFFQSVTAVSGVLQPLLGNEAKIRKTLIEELSKIKPHGHLYLPTNPDTRVLGLQVESAAPMKSHAKVPVLVNFYVRNEIYEDMADTEHDDNSVTDDQMEAMIEEDGVKTQACIFKVGDDVRQDMLAIQFIEFCKNVFDDQELDVFLFPYNVIATHPNEGIIEVVPNSQSRDQLGKKSDGDLFKWFTTKYGAPNTAAYQRARDCFVKSMAAYSVVSYILQVKDRHNGNILVDEEGHLIHIDFGFLFDISPGGDLKFERSPFKLTQEMVDIMGGDAGTEQFQWMMELSTQCFLCLRERQEEILVLIELMLGTRFTCFKPQTMQNLRSRFRGELDVRDACKFFTQDVILASWSGKSQFTTKLYDVFQAWQNQIDW